MFGLHGYVLDARGSHLPRLAQFHSRAAQFFEVVGQVVGQVISRALESRRMMSIDGKRAPLPQQSEQSLSPS